MKTVWKIIFTLLSLCLLALAVSFFLQGNQLATTALNNAQRVIIPLKPDGEWVGMAVRVDDIKPSAVNIVEPQAETKTEPALTDSVDNDADIPPTLYPETEGEIADLTGTNPGESISIEPKSEPVPTQVMVSQDILDQATQNDEADNANDEAAEIITPTTNADSESLGIMKEANQAPALLKTSLEGEALAIAPAPEFSEKLGDYILPKISDDGQKPWQYYAKPFAENEKPVIAVIVHGLGLGRLTTENALNLNSNFTLSFSSYAKNTQMWGDHARNIGHEILLDLPQETQNYPADDPGPFGLLNSLDKATNIARLHWVMNRVAGFVGFLQPNNPAPQSADMLEAFSELPNRGLFLIEAPTDKPEILLQNQKKMGLTHLAYSQEIDAILSEADIKKELAKLVEKAKQQGHVIAIARPYPLTIKMLNEWALELEEQGVALAPVSEVIKRGFK